MKKAPVSRITLALESPIIAVGLYLLIIGAIIWSSYSGAQSMGYNWQWYRIPQYFFQYTDDGFQWGEIVFGLIKTIQLSVAAFILATLMGLLLALLRMSNLIIGTAVASLIVDFVRNIPILVLLYLFYYVLGPIFNLNRYTASILCLAVFHSTLISEIFRGGIMAVPQGQWEAAKSIGMSNIQSYRYIILPQSIRFILPPMTGEMVHLIKNSAIVSVIAVAELTTIGRNIIADTYMSFEIWFTIAAVYMIVTLILSILVSRVEKRYAVQQ